MSSSILKGIKLDPTADLAFPKRSKYGNSKVKDGKQTWDSKLEKSVGDELFLMSKAGEISDIQHHPPVVTLYIGENRWKRAYRPDYAFIRDGVRWLVEAKGFAGERWLWIKGLWPEFGPHPLEIWMAGKHGPVLVETIIPGGGK